MNWDVNITFKDVQDALNSDKYWESAQQEASFARLKQVSSASVFLNDVIQYLIYF